MKSDDTDNGYDNTKTVLVWEITKSVQIFIMLKPQQCIMISDYTDTG
jgi:hypothetical protein